MPFAQLASSSTRASALSQATWADRCSIVASVTSISSSGCPAPTVSPCCTWTTPTFPWMGLVTATSRRSLISVATVMVEAIRVGSTVTKRLAPAGSPECACGISNQPAGDAFHSQAPIPATTMSTHSEATVRTIFIR